MLKKQNLWTVAFYVVTAEMVGALSALLTGSFSDLFLKYEKPPLMPPQWVFPVAWVILYALMGLSAALVELSEARDDLRKRALALYWVQLAVNFSWSIIFFRFEALWAAVGVILLLLLLVVLMAICFGRLRSVAGKLNAPYTLWVSFAVYLNIAAAVLN